MVWPFWANPIAGDIMCNQGVRRHQYVCPPVQNLKLWKWHVITYISSIQFTSVGSLSKSDTLNITSGWNIVLFLLMTPYRTAELQSYYGALLSGFGDCLFDTQKNNNGVILWSHTMISSWLNCVLNRWHHQTQLLWDHCEYILVLS